MKKLYCCESSRRMYHDYYTSQSGSGMPYYQGSPGQRGHGLGSVLSGLFRSAMPMIKRGLAFFGRQALKTGLEVANDVAEGQSFGNSARRRVPEGINRFVSSAGFTPQSGSGWRGRKRKRSVAAAVKGRKRAKKTRKRKTKKTKKPRKSGHSDIFS
jgi:hypothetical protein